jgi:hypothetical protein
MPKRNKQNDISVGKHAAYLRALEAGLLRNGRVMVGGVIDNKKNKAAKDKKLCRKKVDIPK